MNRCLSLCVVVCLAFVLTVTVETSVHADGNKYNGGVDMFEGFDGQNNFFAGCTGTLPNSDCGCTATGAGASCTCGGAGNSAFCTCKDAQGTIRCRWEMRNVMQAYSMEEGDLEAPPVAVAGPKIRVCVCD